MYGVKIENKIIKKAQGSDEELIKQGYILCTSEQEQQIKGNNMLRAELRKEFNSLTVEQLQSEHACELEKKLFWADPDYVKGEPIKRRIKALESK